MDITTIKDLKFDKIKEFNIFNNPLTKESINFFKQYLLQN